VRIVEVGSVNASTLAVPLVAAISTLAESAPTLAMKRALSTCETP
jgi:hypothetical protein